MRSKLLYRSGGQKTYALIFETGDEVMGGLTAFAREQRLGGSRFTAIGAFQDVTPGYFDWAQKDYKRIPVREQVEVVSLVGDVAEGEGCEPKVHAHVVLGRSDGTALGGHLLEAHVRPTLEVMLVESPSHLRRKHDPEKRVGADPRLSKGPFRRFTWAVPPSRYRRTARRVIMTVPTRPRPRPRSRPRGAATQQTGVTGRSRPARPRELPGASGIGPPRQLARRFRE
jgi:predicted DNA-binding protein with PD1-like motif